MGVRQLFISSSKGHQGSGSVFYPAAREGLGVGEMPPPDDIFGVISVTSGAADAYQGTDVAVTRRRLGGGGGGGDRGDPSHLVVTPCPPRYHPRSLIVTLERRSAEGANPIAARLMLE